MPEAVSKLIRCTRIKDLDMTTLLTRVSVTKLGHLSRNLLRVGHAERPLTTTSIGIETRTIVFTKQILILIALRWPANDDDKRQRRVFVFQEMNS